VRFILSRKMGGLNDDQLGENGTVIGPANC
jgi:hypothetical protein